MKTKTINKIIAVCLAAAMILSMAQGLDLKALGADSGVVAIDMSQETVSSTYWTGETTKRFAVTMTNAVEKAAGIKGKGIFRAVEDDISGVWLGETKLEDTANVGVAYGSDGVNWYIGSGWTELVDENGTVLTVRGTFEKTISGVTYQLKMPTVQFQYNAEASAGTSKWSVVEAQKETVFCDLTNAVVTSRNNTEKDRVWANIVDPSVDTTAWKGKSLTAADEQSGIWAGDKRLSSATIYLDKNVANAWRIYAAVSDVTASVVTVKGTFMLEEEVAIYNVRMPEMQFEYHDGKWKIHNYQGDYNGDFAVDVRDLVRLKRYANDSTIAFREAARIDAEADVLKERLLLYGLLLGDGILPGYSRTMRWATSAYGVVSVGTWSGDGFTPYAQEDIDFMFQMYKKAGFNLIYTGYYEACYRGVIGAYGTNSKENPAYELFMDTAQKHGLGVLVDIAYLQEVRDAFGMKTTGDTPAPKVDGLLQVLSKENIPSPFVHRYEYYLYNTARECIRNPACAGFRLSDEWTAQTIKIDDIDGISKANATKLKDLLGNDMLDEVSLYNNVVRILRMAEADAKAAGELQTELIITTSQLPLYETNLDNLTADSSLHSDKEKAYKDYIEKFGATGEFTYDSYRMFCESGAYSVGEDWFTNLKYVAGSGVARTGITIQARKIGTDATYMPVTKADYGFQIYTALAYGMKQINYFSYGVVTPNAKDTDSIAGNSKAYNAVQSINQELHNFGHVLMYYQWKGALDLNAGETGSGEDSSSSRLAEAEVKNARTIVGCMKDVYGFDGYLVANAAGPRTTDASEVTLQFNNAAKAVVYANGIQETVELTNGAITLSIGVGEGVFVIPIE